ncbi:MAG: carbohydrate kinase family protein [Methanobacterium sp. ERen5]|nr:MAG: carbohydrate kinase family protein [Methanobacterium sp. ERen5]
MNQLDVLALGTCNIDFLMDVPRFAVADDEVDTEKLNVTLGGSAANFALKTSDLGLKTGIMARIGKDNYGSYISSGFNKKNVNTERLIPIDEKTGMAFIAVDHLGERSIYTYMGANSKFELLKPDIQLIKNSEILHITGMYIEVVEEASKHANILSFNPGALLASFGMKALEDVLARTDILFLNEKEVDILTGENCRSGAKLLVDAGVKMVVVTLGKAGSKLFTMDHEIHQPSVTVKPVDTTGAGDSFAAGFINGFFRNKNLTNCLKDGNSSAFDCLTKFGSSETKGFK